ncbi:unnamed protein product [Rotaria sp. Silwood1]|nr:unnamed protein product [Rotaria sp. Silwood1]CAF4973691.1 unnamed protein product [Rotaria sp. Silwood1]
MSSSSMVLTYQIISTNLYKFDEPILIILDGLGRIFIIFVFIQKSMCQNPGSIYFIAFNIGNILLLWLSLFPFTYCSISGNDLTLTNLFYCRFHLHILHVIIMLPPSYLILASVD